MKNVCCAFAMLLLLWQTTPMAETSPATGKSELRITFLGTGAPRPSLQRYGPSILVEAGDSRFLIDAGWGVRERLYLAGGYELLTGIDHVVVTHLHFDHTLGLADIWLTGWLYGRRVPLRVQGPAGTEAMLTHIRRAFSWDLENRRLVGVPMSGTQIEASDVTPGVIFERDGLKITAFQVEHMPVNAQTGERFDMEGQTLGYRVDYLGRSAVFSGDTAPSEELIKHAQHVDVLVHETQVPSPGNSKEAKLANISLAVHTSPAQAARIFADTKPRMAVYSHIIPPETSSETLTKATRAGYDGPLTVAHDLMMITIGDDIKIGERQTHAGEAFEQSRVLK